MEIKTCPTKNNNKKNKPPVPSNKSTRRGFIDSLKLISLNAAVTTVLVSLLQFYLIWHRLKHVESLSSTVTGQFAASSQQQQQQQAASSVSFMLTAHSTITHAQILTSITLARLVLVLAALFSVAYSLIGPFRIGVKAHDNFKLGKTLDTTKTTLKNNKNSRLKSPSSTCSTCDEDDDQDDDDNRSNKTTSSSASDEENSTCCCCCYWKRTRSSSRLVNIWSELPPIGAACHLISALFILVADLLLAAIQIQLGLVPAGNIFVTKLDFLYGRPVERQSSLGDMFASKDDFNRFVNYILLLKKK